MHEITQYWSRTCPDGRRYSHWREARDDFDSISRSIGRLIAEQWPDVLEQRNACWLDWGCGGGAGVVALSRLARFVYGVDISTASLKECEKTHRENMGQGDGVTYFFRFAWNFGPNSGLPTGRSL